MAKNNFKIFSYLLIAVFLTLGLSISFQSLLADWKAPSKIPPLCDPLVDNGCDEPINKGSSSQSRIGSLLLGGTAVPGYKLSVVDTGTTPLVNIWNNSVIRQWTGTRLARGGAADGTEKWFIGMDNADDKLKFRRAAGTDDLAIDTAGNVGIGTVSPGYKLDVAGDINVSGVYGKAGAAGASTSCGAGNTPSSVTISGGIITAAGACTPIGGASQWTTSGNNIYNNNTGNVGIGTAAPNNLLSVYDLIDFNNTDFNTKTGYQAGKNIVAGAVQNTYFGYQAGLSSAGASTNAADNNSAFGFRALYFNTTGSSNTANGVNSLSSNNTGSSNTANGMQSLQSNISGSNNTAIGYNTGNGITTGSNNTILGAMVTGLAVNLSNNIIIADGAGNRRINVDQNGNVGIGTAAPGTYKLNVVGTGYFSSNITVNGNITAGQGNYLYFGDTTTGIQGSGSADYLNFRSNDASRMYINSSGNVGIGTISPGAYRLNINGAGYLNAASWTYGSDRRLKEKIDYFYNVGGLDKIIKLKPARFDYINGEKNQLGFIAQDVQEVIPEAVVVADKTSGTLGLKTDFIMPYLVQAVKELAKSLGDLAAKAEDLFNKYLVHDAKIQILEKANLDQQKQIDDLKNQLEAIKSKQ